MLHSEYKYNYNRTEKSKINNVTMELLYSLFANIKSEVF